MLNESFGLMKAYQLKEHAHKHIVEMVGFLSDQGFCEHFVP